MPCWPEATAATKVAERSREARDGGARPTAWPEKRRDPWGGRGRRSGATVGQPENWHYSRQQGHQGLRGHPGSERHSPVGEEAAVRFLEAMRQLRGD